MARPFKPIPPLPLKSLWQRFPVLARQLSTLGKTSLKYLNPLALRFTYSGWQSIGWRSGRLGSDLFKPEPATALAMKRNGRLPGAGNSRLRFGRRHSD